MTDCRFIVIQDDGNPHTVHQHPTPARIGDALGGAIPVPIYMPIGAALLWVRETARREYTRRNLVASVLAHAIGVGAPQPILGPAALTGVEMIVDGGDSHYLPEGVSPEAAAGLLAAIRDTRAAIIGDPWHVFATPGLDERWAGRVRGRAGQAMLTPVPSGWPYVSSACRVDPVWDGLSRAGVGRLFAEIPAPRGV
jgi:hypothetical protein